MESTKEQSRLLHQILPPRLEDAGLEDCALQPESIQEAFFKAASAVKSRHAFIFSTEGEEDADCVNDPWLSAKNASDSAVEIEPENEPPGPCAVEKGRETAADEVKVVGGDVGAVGVEEIGDEVVVGERGLKLGEVGEPCVDELHGLDIKEDVKKKNGGSDEEERKPTLAEGFV